MCQRRHVAHVFRCPPGNRSADKYCLQLVHYLVPSSLTGIRGGLDRSTRRRSVVPRLVSFSFSRARPHRHLFRRRSRARVQRSLWFKRENHRHRSRAARFVDGVVALCARDSSSHLRGETNRGVRFRNDDGDDFVKRGTRSRVPGDDFVKRGTRSRVGNGGTNERFDPETISSNEGLDQESGTAD